MPPSNRPMTDRELAGIIDDQIADSVAYDKSDMADLRQKALNYFEGHKTLGGDAELADGRSGVVSRDMSDTHGWIMPGMLRTFLASERVVCYEPRRPEAQEYAEQATDYVNYVFRAECDGYAVLHAAVWDGLTHGNGIIKHWWDSAPEYCTQSLSGISEAKYIATVNDPNVEVLEHTKRDDPAYAHNAVADGEGMDGPLAAAGGSPEAPDGGEGAAPPAEQSVPAGVYGGRGSRDPSGAGAGAGEDGPLEELPGAVPKSDGRATAAAGAVAPGTGSVLNLASSREAPPLDGLGALAAPQLHDLKIKRKLYDGRVRCAAVPHEEFRIDRDAIKLDEGHVRFCAHVSHNRTRSSLIEAGYPADIVNALPAHVSGTDDQGARSARGQSSFPGVAPDHSTDLIQIWECYVQVDYDGDGVAEWRQVITAAGNESGPTGRAILSNEEWGDPLPFSDLVPDPMPHRWRGGSLYEEVGDLQLINTVILRGILDNTYWINNLREEVVLSQVLPESMKELYNPTFGGKIFTKTPGTITPLPVEFIADKLMSVLDLTAKIRESRTGVSAVTKSLDPEALQTNQTATAANLAATASYSKIETYARNCAEGGVKRLFRCLLKLIVQHQDKPRTIRLRGEWVDMSPNSWDSDMDVIINVGLGSGSRERDVAIIQAISAEQKAIIAGLTPMVAAQLGLGPDVVFATDRKMVEAAGLKSPETYFPEISRADVDQLMQQMQAQQAQTPDPKMAESQVKIQVMQQEMQAKIQSDQQRMQIEQEARQQQAALDWQHKQQQSDIDNQHREQEIRAKGEAMMRELAMKHQLAVEQAQRDFVLKQQEAQANAELKGRELEMEAALKERELAMRPQESPNIQEAQT